MNLIEPSEYPCPDDLTMSPESSFEVAETAAYWATIFWDAPALSIEEDRENIVNAAQFACDVMVDIIYMNHPVRGALV